ncbi:low choriolytic enzyme-like [Chironomus tepperi]|uniref:low choriolytic enzyme-like n=1 Tax=Chironomus tepperi TaxID=113505 RepID=UPI00391F0C69
MKSANDTDSFIGDEKPDPSLLYGDLYQGDIDLTEEQKEFLEATANGSIDLRVGISNPFYRWPKDSSGNVIVPYKFSNKYRTNERYLILGAMKDIEEHTCIRFRPVYNEYDYISIKSGRDCSSSLGKIGGRQTVSLNQNGCISRGTILHALFHVLGFDHMQNHMDRDNYIDIHWKNIKDDKIEQFLKVDSRYYDDFNTSYDYYSVTHYSPTAFSKNGRRTITTKNSNFRNVIGQLPRLSSGDITRVNNMYKCNRRYYSGK